MRARNSPPSRRPVRSLWHGMIAVLALVMSVLVATPAQAAPVVGFNPESIISDALFYDSQAMTSAEIQSFLDQKIGTCKNGKCLNVLTTGISSRAAVTSQTTGNLICSAIQGGSMKVSELIYRVQVACGISAKVILVTLQKEQGLTTSKEPSDWNLRAAMGASCPDTAPCDPAFAGVGPQILKGAQQLKTYKAAKFAKQPGNNYIGYSPNSSCGGTTLNIRNYATAALYNYTPYQPNAAALAAGFGLGDGCSSYGNRNFYNYYTQWFGSADACAAPAPSVVKPGTGAFVTTAALNGRAAPSTECDRILEVIPTGSVAIKTGEFGSWWLVQRNGQARWVSKDFLSAVPATDTPFVDVSSVSSSPVFSEFSSQISWMKTSGISAGWTVNGSVEYRPSLTITRDAMAAFLYRLAGTPSFSAPAVSPFQDVPTSHVFYKEITWLASTGVSTGWEKGAAREFRPSLPVTRDAMAAFLYRFAGSPSVAAPAASPFRDVAPAQAFYKEITWLASSEVSGGGGPEGAREFRPSAAVTRDAMAAFVQRTHRYLNMFADVASSASSPQFSEFAGDIAWLSSAGVATGWAVNGSLEYRPSLTITRDAMAAFLYRLAGSPSFTAPAVSPFRDVSTAHVFYKEITWLASTGVSTGWGAGAAREFRPDASVTRDAMAAFLYRSAGSPSFAAPAVSPFRDVAVGQPFYKEIAWLASTGVSTGWGQGSAREFKPFASVTRDAMAAFVHRFHRNRTA